MNNRSALSVTREITRKLFRIRTSLKSPCKSFRMRTYKSVSKQRTSTPFRINTYKKQGGGGVSLLLTVLVLRFRSDHDSQSTNRQSRITNHLVSFQALPHSLHSCRAQKSPQPLFFLPLPHSCE